MKPRFVIILVAIAFATTTALAARSAWDRFKRPPVSLGLALQLCLDDLQNRYGKDAGDFYCVKALVQRTFSKSDWELEFYQEGVEAEGLFYNVGSDKVVRFSKGGFEY